MRNLAKFFLFFNVVSCSLIRETVAQEFKIGVLMYGYSEGESYKVESHGTTGGSIQGGHVPGRKDTLVFYHTLSEADSSTMRKRVETIELYVKKKFGLRYKRAHPLIPEGLHHYLLLRRDRTLKRGQYFTATWTDESPLKKKIDPYYNELFRRDTAIHNLPVPEVDIKLFDKPFTAETIKQEEIQPRQFIYFSIYLNAPPSSPDLFAKLDGLELMFVHNNGVMYRMSEEGKSIYTIYWPLGFRSENGYMIVVNVAYSYYRNGEFVESATVSRNVKL